MGKLHVLTPHHGRMPWHELQLRYLRKNLSGPHRTWAALPPGTSVDGYDRVLGVDGQHQEKIAALFATAKKEMQPGDLVMLLDSDAFPVRPLTVDWIYRQLESHTFIAILRAREWRPHASFLVAPFERFLEWELLLPTMGQWHVLVQGRRGGHCLKKIKDPFFWLERLIDERWLPLRVTARLTPRHVDSFSVYGDLIYHHMAGSAPVPLAWAFSLRGKSRVGKRKASVKKLSRMLMGQMMEANDFWDLPTYPPHRCPDPYAVTRPPKQ